MFTRTAQVAYGTTLFTHNGTLLLDGSRTRETR